MEYFDRFLTLLAALDRERVEYILIGGVAVNLHGIIRHTEDIDLFVRPVPENVDRLKRALRAVWDDPAIEEISADDLAGNYSTIRYGPPGDEFYVDILSCLGTAFRYDDLDFTEVEVDGVPVRLATPETLVEMKRDTVRLRDKDDVARLRNHLQLAED